jgi:hypothetical protein
MNREGSEITSEPQHELIGYCMSCGMVFELQEAACPRCARCPECGSKKSPVLESCVVCGHPADKVKLARLAQRLDLALASNQREQRRLDERCQDDAQVKRINNWKLFAVIVGVFIAVVLPVLVISLLVRIPMWIANPGAIILSLILLRIMIRQTRRGRFQWLLRKEEREAGR